MKLRTRYLVQPKFQLLFSGILAGIALIVAVAVGAIIYVLIYSHNLIFVKYNVHTSPEFLDLLIRQGKMVTTTWILSFSAVAIILFVAGMFLSHRMAGPLYALLREMKKIKEGKLNARLTLRKRDDFKNLKSPFNQWVETLQHEAEHDVE